MELNLGDFENYFDGTSIADLLADLTLPLMAADSVNPVLSDGVVAAMPIRSAANGFGVVDQTAALSLSASSSSAVLMPAPDRLMTPNGEETYCYMSASKAAGSPQQPPAEPSNQTWQSLSSTCSYAKAARLANAPQSPEHQVEYVATVGFGSPGSPTASTTTNWTSSRSSSSASSDTQSSRSSIDAQSCDSRLSSLLLPEVRNCPELLKCLDPVAAEISAAAELDAKDEVPFEPPKKSRSSRKRKAHAESASAPSTEKRSARDTREHRRSDSGDSGIEANSPVACLIELNRATDEHIDGGDMAHNSTSAEAVSDTELANMSSRSFNLLLQSLSKPEARALKRRRRTVKNRSYAATCRLRRVEQQRDLKHESDRLREELRIATEQLNEVRRQLVDYRSEIDQMRKRFAAMPMPLPPVVSASWQQLANFQSQQPLVSSTPAAPFYCGVSIDQNTSSYIY